MRSHFKNLCGIILTTLLLCSCGSGSSDSGLDVVVTEPPVVTGPVISGIAAVGEALDGASVEIVDSAGNLVEVGDVLTGADGAYLVTLPAGVSLPVIVRVTPPDGEPLLSIVPPSTDGDSEVTANVNPITNLVSNELLTSTDPTDNSALAGALATVDTANIDTTADAVVSDLFGSDVSYSNFASDENFVAKSSGSDTPPSAADAILDTLARRAAANGTTVSEQLSALNAQEDPPRLLEEPDFQVSLVSELVKGGTAAEDLETELSAIGALPSDSENEADVFRAVIETVPELIATVREGATDLSANEDLLDIATDAAVDLLATTLQEKKERLDTDDTGLIDALNSPALSETVNKVVQGSIVPTLTNFVDSDTTEELKEDLSSVANQVAQQAAAVTTSIQFTEDSADVSDLVSSFVSERVTPIASLDELETATSDSGQVIEDLGDINDVKTSIQNFADENSDLLEGPVDNLVETVPAGTWDNSNWGDFNWG